ncbi:MAG: Gfo/Idh/MocA family oxidoreductase [Bryobacterales bacterium]|nr:Gfo/Idh/MocA family oxidoreductase [Bryobacterales bacterium]
MQETSTSSKLVVEPRPVSSRRSFLGAASSAGAAASAFMIIKPQLVRGQGKERLKAGIIGTGGRGSGAIMDMLQGTENVDLTVMGDMFEDRLEGSLRNVRERAEKAGVADRIKVAPDARFMGPDAYKKVLATDIDIVLLCTPPGYRSIHFEAAIKAGKHLFAEKPFAVDAVGCRKVMDACREATRRNLTIMTGAQRRYQQEYVETVDKIRSGAIGEILSTEAHWEGTPVIQQRARQPQWSDSEFQHRAWYSFVWICGDQIVEQHLHNIDVINWVMGMHPVKVTAMGGAAWRPREEIYGNIYDHIAAQFEYPNGVRMLSYCRQYPRELGYNNISEMVVGSKGVSNCRNMGTRVNVSPYVAEHTAMAASIRGERPYINDGLAVAESTMTCIMARESAYTGQTITWDMMMQSNQDLMPKDLSNNAKIPVPPLPVPGVYKFV